MNTHYWIWYPGDFELYHAMKQNFSRVERGMGWPAYWKSEGFRNRVIFRRVYDLQSESEFTVYSDAVGYVLAGDRKYPFGKKIRCSSGKTEISVHAACIETFPAIYIDGKEIYSDGEWMAADYDKPPVKAGYSRYFTHLDQKPSRWEYSERIYDPVNVTSVANGVLYEFETELTAALEIRCRNGFRPLTVYCGESREEALDTVHCYYSCSPDKNTGRCPRCAVRFAYIPDCSRDELEVRAVHQFIDIPVRAEFHSSDELLNRIWQGLIVEHVLRNDRIPRITTPYFKFYELDVLCRKGYLAEVLQLIREYWGGMLERGAVTFWEEYDPGVPDDQQYDMYGDRFGKSLCHAWAASPIYLLAKYFVGLQITDGEKGEYSLEPHLEYFSSLECTLPVKDRQLNMVWDGENLTKNWFDSIEDSRIE